MKERISSVHKIRSGDEEWNEGYMKHLDAIFEKKSFWHTGEMAKTREELQIIKTLVPRLEKYLGQYGAQPLKLAARHVVLLDRSRMSQRLAERVTKDFQEGTAFFDSGLQRVYVLDGKTFPGLSFAHKLTHELVHFYSYSALKNSSVPRGASHLGVQVGKFGKTFFTDLNEAITEELTIRFFGELKSIPSLKKEAELVEEFREQQNRPDIAAAPPVRIMGKRQPKNHPGYILERQAYPGPRRMLYQLIDEIDVANLGKFKDKEEIFAVFARAAMTGEYKEMASLVEGLGRGRLRKLANSNIPNELDWS